MPAKRLVWCSGEGSGRAPSATGRVRMLRLPL